MHTCRLTRLRRRQPLLRGARRVHPPPRPGARAPGHRSGSRSAAASTTPSAAGSAGPSPTRPSTRSPRPARWSTTSGATPTAGPMHELMGTPEPIRPEYRDRDARLATMDAQGLAKVWLFPTLGMLYEEALKHDPGRGRPPVPGLQPLAGRGLGHGVPGPDLRRPLHLAGRRRRGGARARMGARPGRPHRRHAGRRADHRRRGRSRRPTDVFDPFWARVNEAGITVVVHAGDAGLSSNGYAADGFSASFRGGAGPAEHQDVRH